MLYKGFQGPPFWVRFWPDFRVQIWPILGARRRAAPGRDFPDFPDFRNFRIFPPGRDPVLDPLLGGCRRGVTWEVL